jgi:hypothetical protein
MTSFIEEYSSLFIGVTFGFLGFAFYLTYRPRPGASVGKGGESADKDGGCKASSARSSVMSFNKIMLWVVTAIAVVFLFFPQRLEGLTGARDEFTDDMVRSVIRIEGMT